MSEEYLKNVSIKADILAGTTIRHACRDMCELAGRLGCAVEARFNGVTLIAKPGGESEEMARRCHEALSSGRNHQMIFSE